MLCVIVYLSLICSALLMSFSTPPWMVCAIILQTLSVGAYLSYVKSSMWGAYILLLIFLGGMLVVFSYISSLASMEMLEEIPYMSLFITQVFAVMLVIKELLLGMELSIKSELLESGAEGDLNMFDLFSIGGYLMYLLATGCLLLALFCVVNMTKSTSGPLRLLSLLLSYASRYFESIGKGLILSGWVKEGSVVF